MKSKINFLLFITFGLFSFTNPELGYSDTSFKSCNFESRFSEGCIEFLEGNWTDEKAREHCESNAKSGTTPEMSTNICSRNKFNTLCITSEDNLKSGIYSNDMPEFVCKHFLNGTLNKRSGSTW